jgi:hypothetical protein
MSSQRTVAEIEKDIIDKESVKRAYVPPERPPMKLNLQITKLKLELEQAQKAAGAETENDA